MTYGTATATGDKNPSFRRKYRTEKVCTSVQYVQHSPDRASVCEAGESALLRNRCCLVMNQFQQPGYDT